MLPVSGLPASKSLIPIPKALVLPRRLANVVHNFAIALTLVPRLSPLALQLLGAVDLIVYVRVLGDGREGVTVAGLAANCVVERVGITAE